MKALYLTKDPEFKAEIAELDESALPEGDVTLKVAYSTVNYKDALAITNKSPIVRKWPMVAGIDGRAWWRRAAIRGGSPATRSSSTAGEWARALGRARAEGALQGRLAGASAGEHVAAPRHGDRHRGYTAMLCAMAIEREGIRPERGEVLVTGATGGVGQRGRGDLGSSRVPRRGLHGQGLGGLLRDLARGGHDAEAAMGHDRHGHAADARPWRR